MNELITSIKIKRVELHLKSKTELYCIYETHIKYKDRASLEEEWEKENGMVSRQHTSKETWVVIFVKEKYTSVPAAVAQSAQVRAHAWVAGQVHS